MLRPIADGIRRGREKIRPRHALFLAALFIAVPVEAADPAPCRGIRDRRADCLAVGESRPSRCSAIRNSDRRSFCLARTTDRNSRCHAIRDPDLRKACRAATGSR